MGLNDVIGASVDMIKIMILAVGVMGIPFNRKKSNAVLFVGILNVAGISVCLGWLDYLYFHTGIFLLLELMLLKGNGFQRVRFFFFSYFMIGMVDIVVGTAFCLITQIKMEQITNEMRPLLLVNIFAIILWIAICFFAKKKRKEIYEFWSTLRLREYFLILFTLITLSGACASMQDALFGSNSDTSKMMGLCMLVLFFILVIILESYFIVTFEKNRYLFEVNKINNKHMSLQKRYFAEMKEKNDDLRKFRHDLAYHITALHSYCEKGEYDKISSYLNEMYALTKQNSVYHTGNFIIDTLLEQIITQDVAKQRYKFTLLGNLSNELKVEDNDFSVLLGNLLMNAKEAVEQCDKKNREITLELSNYQEKMFIYLKNTCKEDFVEIPSETTKKKNKKDHGFGLQAIDHIVRKYDGGIIRKVEKGEFIVEISI